jgi:hypothetical protein
MYFYILMIPSMLSALIMIFMLHRLRKHDRVLFEFCENRRDIMGYLREEGADLSVGDYVDVRSLVEVANGRIHYFNECKPYHFNLRRFMEYLGSVKQDDEAIHIENERVVQLYDRHVYALLRAFFAFTPFIKSELVLGISIAIASALAQTGFARVKRKAAQWADVIRWVESEASQRQLLYR